MAFFQFVPDLFLEVAELNRFKQFVDDEGFRKALLEDSVNFGLIKSAADITFANGKVQRDLPNSLGQQCIKINALHAIDSSGEFIEQAALSQIPVPGDGNWYWIKIAHQYNPQEVGSVTVDASGNLVGTGTAFTQVLRGSPNFPSRIKFIGTVGNLLEYDVLSVTDDTHAIVVHPAVTVGGQANFIAESNLGYEVVGTFTPGVAVPSGNQFPFQYDSCDMSLEVEASVNTRPTYTVGQEFFLARVQVINGQLIIQDKRTDYWETKGSAEVVAIDTAANPLIGVEDIRWQNTFTPGATNQVFIAWGMRSTNFTIDTSQNLVTMNAAVGGAWQNTSSFTNGNFDGWRLYTANGNYRTVVTSVKQGGAINLFLDMLDVDDFSTDGGVTFIAQTIVTTPDAEEVLIQFTAPGVPNVNQTFTQPIASGGGRFDVVCFGDPTCLYNVQYAYKSFKEYTGFQPIVSGSYLTEVSYDANGNLLPSDSQVSFTYTSDPVAAFIQLTISPHSFERFSGQVFKGDLIGVNTISSFSAGQVLQLIVGEAARYQHIVGNISLTDDIFISLSRSGAVAGNEFRLHFECTSLNIGVNHIYIADNYAGGSLVVVKVLVQGDAYQMLNQDGGLVIDCVYDGTQWIAYQNYDLGRPFEIVTLDGDPSALFDLTSGMGKIEGYFGYCLCNAPRTVNGVIVPNLTDRFIVAAGNTYGFGATGGEASHILTIPETPVHRHTTHANGGITGSGGPYFLSINNNSAYSNAGSDQFGRSTTPNPNMQTSDVGGGQPHNNLPPYYAAFMAKKLF